MERPVTLPPLRQGHPAPPDLAARREQLAQARAAGMWKTDLVPQSVAMGENEALWFRSSQPRGVILTLHGGGFRQGAPEIGSAFAQAIVSRCDVDVYALRYRLAPEYPFPAGLTDAWNALAIIRAARAGLPLIVCGDSAGGGLAASVAVLNGSATTSLIEGLVLLSPWLDLTVTAPAYESAAATDPLFSRETAQVAAQLYLQGEDPAHPLASPLYADASGFPKTLIVTGDGEVLLDDSTRLESSLRAAQVPAVLQIVEGMEHVAVTRDLSLRGSAECFEHVAAFIDEVVAAAAPEAFR